MILVCDMIFVRLTQEQKYTPCFFQVHMDSANCCEQQAFSNTHVKENLQRYLRSWGGH